MLFLVLSWSVAFGYLRYACNLELVVIVWVSYHIDSVAY